MTGVLARTERRVQAALLTSGTLVLLIGLIVLIGWHSHNQRMIRLRLEYVPMAYATAVGFVSAGLALLASAFGRRRTLRWAALVTLLLGLLTVLEYGLGVNLGIDFNFSGFDPGTAFLYANRMAPNTALCFALSGSALVLMAERRGSGLRPRVLMLLGPVVVALAAVAIFGYLTGVETAYQWGRMAEMAFPTATGFLLLGIGLCAFAWLDSRHSGLQPTWLPVFVALGMSLGTSLMWLALSQERQRVVDETIQAQAAVVRNEIQSRMEARVLALGRTAARIRRLGDYSAEQFNLDSQLLLNDYAGFQAIEQIGPDYRIGWVYPTLGNEAILDFNLLDNPIRRKLLAEARRSEAAAMSPAIPLLQGGQGLVVYYPVIRDERLLGFVGGVMRIDTLFTKVLDPRYIAPGYNITVRHGGSLVVHRELGASPADAPQAVTPVDVAGTRWQATLTPTQRQLRRLNNPLPEVVLVTGLCLAWLLGLAVFLAQTGALRAREAEGANLALAQEIEVRKQAEAALTRRTTELSRSNADLEQFAYVASHDLQEPLRMVASYLQLLERRYRDQLDDEAREFIDFAVDGATRMRTLINDLLLYSRVGTRGRPFEPTDLNQLTDRVLDNLAVAIEETAAEIIIAPLPKVNVDPVQIGQVLQNLIGNAVKFRGDAPPRIEISASPLENGWRIEVRDNGIGVPPQYAERIFLIFQRLHSRAEYDGTGIGLAICKKIIERHGGRIGVTTDQEPGSQFWFTLPAAEETTGD